MPINNVSKHDRAIANKLVEMNPVSKLIYILPVDRDLTNLHFSFLLSFLEIASKGIEGVLINLQVLIFVIVVDRGMNRESTIRWWKVIYCCFTSVGLINAATMERFMESFHNRCTRVRVTCSLIIFASLKGVIEEEATCSFVPTARDRVIAITSKGFKGKQSRFCESSQPVVKTHANIFIDCVNLKLVERRSNMVIFAIIYPAFQFQSERINIKSLR